MASTSNFSTSTATTPIQLAFLPSTMRTSSLGLTLDSNSVVGGRNPFQTSYLMSVTFNAAEKGLFITEHVKSTAKAKANNGVMGTTRIPFTEIEEPEFMCSGTHRNFIKISLPLRQDTEFGRNHYSSELFGKWKHGSQQVLQMKQLNDFPHKIRRVEITIFNAPEAPSFVRTQVLNVFGLTVAAPQTLSNEPKRNPSRGKSQAANAAMELREDIEPAKEHQNVQVKHKVAHALKRKQEETARLRNEKASLVKISLASSKFDDTSRTLCITSVVTETEARNLLPHSYEYKIAEVSHVTDFVGENYFMFDFGSLAFAQEALVAATHWVNVTQWPRPSPVVALISEQTKLSILKSAVEEKPSPPSDFSSTTEEFKQPEDDERDEGFDSVKEDEQFPDAASILPAQVQDTEAMHQMCEDQLQVLLKAVGDSRRQEASDELLEEVLDEHAHRTSSSASRGRTVFVTTIESEEKVADIFDYIDHKWITSINPMVSEDHKNGLKIDFVSRGSASEALKNTRQNMHDECDDWKERPTIDFDVDEGVKRAKLLSTRAGRARIFAPSITQTVNASITQLRKENETMQFQIRYLRERYLERGEQVEELQLEVARLKRKLEAATMPSQQTSMEHESVDLLSLDIEQDLGEDSTFVHDPNILEHRQPSWLESVLSLPSSYLASDKSPPQSRVATHEVRLAELGAIVSSEESTTLTTTDTVRRIDDAVNAMGQVQRHALQAGDAVTVEIRKPKQMTDWLEQRGQGVVNVAGSRRALAVLWL